VLPLSLAVAALLTLAADLDRPQTGLIKVGQQSMIDLQGSVRRDAAPQHVRRRLGAAPRTQTAARVSCPHLRIRADLAIDSALATPFGKKASRGAV